MGMSAAASDCLRFSREVLDAVDVPVVAAGGIGNARTAAAALAAGADAVRVGTRFVATQEADTHPDYADALVRARAEDTVLTEAFSVMWPDAPHRVLRSCVDKAQALDDDAVGEVEIGGTTMPVPRLWCSHRPGRPRARSTQWPCTPASL